MFWRHETAPQRERVDLLWNQLHHFERINAEHCCGDIGAKRAVVQVLGAMKGTTEPESEKDTINHAERRPRRSAAITAADRLAAAAKAGMPVFW